MQSQILQSSLPHFIKTTTRTKFSQLPVLSSFSFNAFQPTRSKHHITCKPLGIAFLPVPCSLLSKINISTYLLTVSVKKRKCIFVQETAKQNDTLVQGVQQTLRQRQNGWANILKDLEGGEEERKTKEAVGGIQLLQNQDLLSLIRCQSSPH